MRDGPGGRVAQAGHVGEKDRLPVAAYDSPARANLGADLGHGALWYEKHAARDRVANLEGKANVVVDVEVGGNLVTYARDLGRLDHPLRVKGPQALLVSVDGAVIVDGGRDKVGGSAQAEGSEGRDRALGAPAPRVLVDHAAGVSREQAGPEGCDPFVLARAKRVAKIGALGKRAVDLGKCHR